jgi:hypothetical protein
MNIKLFELIDRPINELKKLKIGVLVRSTLPIILENALISDIEINKLTTMDYSKIVFDMNYPILKKINNNFSIKENRLVGEYTRYYAEPIDCNNTSYLVSSEWYDRSQEDYIRWLKRKVKKD